MISDEILFLQREFIEKERGNPTFLYMSPENYALLREERGVDIEDEFIQYHGMRIIVSEDIDDMYLTCELNEIFFDEEDY